jgi:DNA-binding response OmpR family regulator
MNRILIVEDEYDVARQLHELLEQEHYTCHVAHNYKDALECLDDNLYSLVLLDWNLPDGDGLTLLELLREEENPVPVLMLSAKSTVDDRVRVLNAGGDDYLCKPYSNLELLARIRALLRREIPQKNTLLKSGEITLDSTSREVYVGDTPISLSPAEFDILELLMQNKNVVLTRYQLNEHLGQDFNTLKQSNVVDVHIKNLRKKIGIDGCIVTVRGVGYKIGG